MVKSLIIFLILPLYPGTADQPAASTPLAHTDSLLQAGKLDDARGEFRKAANSNDPDTRLAGLLGLGRVYRQIPGKRMESLRQLRKAERAYPGNREVLFELALTGFELGESSGAVIADNALAELICLDLGYRGAYDLWHEKIRGRSPDNMERVAICLPSHIAQHPELSHLWLDIAYDWFELFKTKNCLAALDSLVESAPEHEPQERLLLRARCLLALGDTFAFEEYYHRAVQAAEREGDFNRLIAEAETIFTPAEVNSLGKLKTAERVASFLRVFWRNKNPDPVTDHNERLVEHYKRLREAELKYKMLTPDGLVQKSADYLRLMSRTPGIDGGPDGYPYEYDPVKVFGGRSPELKLDHRGLLYIRHGHPDYIDREYIKDRRDGFVENLGASDLLDIPNAAEWFYGVNKIVFKSGLGTGGYLFYPSVDRDVADIEHAMNTQTYKDPLPEKPQDFYSAAFRRGDGRLDLEFYQSVPVSDSRVAEPPQAWMVLYDRSLRELARDSAISVSANSPDGNVWLAVNSLPVDPVDCSFVLSVDLPEVRSVVKDNIHLDPIDGRKISSSGIVLGVDPGPGKSFYRRGPVELLPRPSLEFGLDELIEAVVEVYNLSPTRDGNREYDVRVTVKLLKEDLGQISKLMRKFRLLGEERSAELTLRFERSASGSDGAVAEHFSINTTELIPGEYGLKIEIVDRHGGGRTSAVRNFSLVN